MSLSVLPALPASAATRPGRALPARSVDVAHLSWTRSPAGAPGAGNLNGLATDGKRFVTIGLTGNSTVTGFVPIWTSSDGVRWKQATGPSSAFPANLVGTSVVHQGHRFLAFGYPRASTGTVLAWTSKDGTKWVRYHPKGFPPRGPGAAPQGATATKNGVLLRVVDVNGTWHLWGSNGDRWRALGDLPSAGQASTSRTLPGRHGHGFVTVGTSNNAAAAWTSKTGSTWRTASIGGMAPGDGSTIADAVAGGPGFVAVGSAAGPGHEVADVWTSADGKLWQPASGNTAAFTGRSGTLTAMDVATTSGKNVIAAGTDRSSIAIWTSHGGRSWKEIPADLVRRVQTGVIARPTGVSVANGHVVVVLREESLNSTGGFDISGLGIISGSAKR
jgi:hypothetical protein